jgi:ATP-dependent Clp protease protease subunit
MANKANGDVGMYLINNDGDLEKNGYFLLSDPITEQSVAPLIKFILAHNLRDPKLVDHIKLIINSPGGSVDAAFALIDIMRASRIPVQTYGLGMIASAALMIFMAGKKGHRYASPYTSILSHQWSWRSDGKEHELFATQKEFENVKERVIDLYMKSTGLPRAKIVKYLLPASDVWLTATEAKKYGLIDHIITHF